MNGEGTKEGEDGGGAVSKVPSKINHQVIEILKMNSSKSSDSSGDENDPEDSSFTNEESGMNIPTNAYAIYKAKFATNREAFGTWNNPLDFTLTLIGYIIGIHNFFRFPHLCYKFGTFTFLIPYTMMMVVIGIPAVFMECTIGQYYGVGSISAFRKLAPIITGVSYILAWNSFINCWMYGILLTWLRAYSGDSLSCLKGWIGCHEDHYYNTPYCWTGTLDQCCTNITMEDYEDKCPFHKSQALGIDSIYFNYKCTKTQEFCQSFGWTYVPGSKQCWDAQNKSQSLYKRRFHATYEYFYGYVLGMRKVMVQRRKKYAKQECLTKFNKGLIKDCSNISKTEKAQVTKDVISKEEFVKNYWTEDGQRLQVDPESSSFIQLPTFAFTTCLFITFFLFDNLLSVSVMTYVLNGVPFVVLIYLTFVSMQFTNASKGVEDIISLRGISHLNHFEIWTESIVQVLVTTGVGNGALISLASFNKYRHAFLFDLIFVMGLNILTSILATVICFCTIGHYIKENGIMEKFEDFIQTDSYYSSVQFAYIVYSYFLTQINGLDITTLLFFFSISSFPTDTAIRLAQNVLDATVHVLPRLKFHPTMALLGVSVFYLLTLLPVTRNGGIALFLEYEYFSLYYAIPIITLIEVVSVGWVYTASRVMDNAEQLEVVSNYIFRKYFIISIKYVIPILLVFVVGASALSHADERFQSFKSGGSRIYTVIFGYLFCLTPVLLFLLSILKQLVALPKSKWKDLFHPISTFGGHKDALTKSRKAMFKSVNKLKVQVDKIFDTDNYNLERKEQTDPSSKEAKYLLKKSSKNVGDKEKRGKTESIGSIELAHLKSYLFWNGVLSYLDDWPDRLDDTEVESEGSSVSSDIEEDHHSKRPA